MFEDKWCWICHRECYAKLICTKCGRNFHIACVPKGKITLAQESNGYKKFETFCSECIEIDYDAKKWSSGQDFEPITKRKLNRLLLYILYAIKKEARGPFLWPSSKFRMLPNPIDVKQIQEKANRNYYDCPKAFLGDINYINHNCQVLHYNSPKFHLDKVLCKELEKFIIDYDKFKRNTRAKVGYLEDCPHCIFNFIRSSENWLTMACPWGHPIIIVEVEKKFQPAKLVKFNREALRVDIILFGSTERARVLPNKCWIPSSSDLVIDEKDGEKLSTAKKQANIYIEVLEKKFKNKITFETARRQLTTLDKDYIQKNVQPDIVELIDDDVVDIVETVESNDINGETDEQKDGQIVSDETNGEVRNENSSKNSSIDTVDDEVIDEIGEFNESSSIVEDTIILANKAPPLTTLIERIPSPIPSDQSEPIKNSNQVPAPKLQPLIMPTSTQSISNGPSIELTSKEPSSSTELISNDGPPKLTTKPTLVSTAIFTSASSTTPPPTPPTSSINDSQFAIVSDEDDDNQTIETDDESNGETTTNINESLPSPMFVIEEDQDQNGIAEFIAKPVSPCRLYVNQEDPAFDLASTSNGFTLNHSSSSSDQSYSDLLSSVKVNGFDDLHQSKKMKLDQEIANNSHVWEIKRMEQQLEFAEKEKKLNLQQIAEVQEQLKLTKQMEETKFNNMELQLKQKMKILEDALENEKRIKEEVNGKLLKSIEERVKLTHKVDKIKLSWQKKLTEEIEAINKQHKQEMDNLLEKNVSLEEKLKESETRYAELLLKYNTTLPKYKRLSKTLLSLSQDFADDKSPEENETSSN